MSDSTINSVLPALRIEQPTEVDGYLIVARDLLQGVEALASLQNISPRSCALIAAQALECALKAFLWHREKAQEIRWKDLHNLVVLWDKAYKEGLDIEPSPPDWCAILSSGHGPIFYFRYQEGDKKNIVHGGQTPALIPMSIELKKLIKIVEHAVSAAH